ASPRHMSDRRKAFCTMNINPQVDDFMAKLDHPLKAEMQRVREIILEADARMTEVVKWGGPTFMYKGNLATLTPRSKRFVNLFFQTGATIPDGHGILEGDANEVRVAHFHNMQDIDEKEAALKAVVQEWITLRDGA
ncbi:MAG: DUF1801 domain-containing protein, partial [Anaerolineae bacterium]|nr:DUF1801 domain-containing protein [Anaerolineae bacterium]